MNNDFWSLELRFANDFRSWLHHSWKWLAHRLTWQKKSLFMVTHALNTLKILQPCTNIKICHHDMELWNFKCFQYVCKSATGSNIPGRLNTLRPRQDGRYFADDIFKCIFFNENGCILIKCSLKYVRKGSIDNNPPLVPIMAWRRSGDKPLSEPMLIILPTHICVTRPQWVKWCSTIFMISTDLP